MYKTEFAGEPFNSMRDHAIWFLDCLEGRRGNFIEIIYIWERPLVEKRKL